MTMRAVTLRRKQEKRKNRSRAHQKSIFNGKGRNDEKRFVANMAKREIRMGDTDMADWELELLGWKKTSPEVVPVLEAVSDTEAFNAGVAIDHPSKAVGKLGWAQTNSRAKFHRVSVTDGAVTGVDACPVARKADFNQDGAALRFSPTYLESNTCAKCASIGA